MWRQNGYEPFEASSAPEDGRDQDEPVSTHFNTNNFGNFLEVHHRSYTLADLPAACRGFPAHLSMRCVRKACHHARQRMWGMPQELLPHACQCSTSGQRVSRAWSRQHSRESPIRSSITCMHGAGGPGQADGAVHWRRGAQQRRGRNTGLSPACLSHALRLITMVLALACWAAVRGPPALGRAGQPAGAQAAAGVLL